MAPHTLVLPAPFLEPWGPRGSAVLPSPRPQPHGAFAECQHEHGPVCVPQQFAPKRVTPLRRVFRPRRREVDQRLGRDKAPEP